MYRIETNKDLYNHFCNLNFTKIIKREYLAYRVSH